ALAGWFRRLFLRGKAIAFACSKKTSSLAETFKLLFATKLFLILAFTTLAAFQKGKIYTDILNIWIFWTTSPLKKWMRMVLTGSLLTMIQRNTDTRRVTIISKKRCLKNFPRRKKQLMPIAKK